MSRNENSKFIKLFRSFFSRRGSISQRVYWQSCVVTTRTLDIIGIDFDKLEVDFTVHIGTTAFCDDYVEHLVGLNVIHHVVVQKEREHVFVSLCLRGRINQGKLSVQKTRISPT